MTKLYELPLAGPISAGDWLLVSQSGHSRKVSALAVAGPQGEQGPQGPVGATGPQGEPADPAESIHAATTKPTPADADELGITDSAASWGLKKLTFANLRAWFGSLFVSKSGGTITGNLSVTGDTLVTGGGALGYGIGSGGTVTQPASDGNGGVGKGSRVTLNKPSGVITTQAASLAPGQSVLFDSFNTLAYGCVCVATVETSTPEYWNYKADAVVVGGGQITFRLTNMAHVSLAGNVVIKFALLNIATT